MSNQRQTWLISTNITRVYAKVDPELKTVDKLTLPFLCGDKASIFVTPVLHLKETETQMCRITHIVSKRIANGLNSPLIN